MHLKIPNSLLPADGRFGCGPAKIRQEALDYLHLRNDLLGTSHRQKPVKDLVQTIKMLFKDLYQLPDGYEILLGNGGASLVWDLVACSLVRHSVSHAVFGEFGRKFSQVTQKCPYIDNVFVNEVPLGQSVLPKIVDEADVYAWPQNETSTGACAPVNRIHEDSLMVVDATSAAGGMSVDLSQTDFYYFSLQKNFASDGGLWVAFASENAITVATKIAEKQRWIPDLINFNLALQNSRANQTLNTPALATLLLLEDQLNWISQKGGLKFAAQRCESSSNMLYQWAEQHPLADCLVTDKQLRSPVVCTIKLDPKIDANLLCQIMRHNGIVDLEPYRKLKLNHIRIGVYTAVEPADVEALINCLNYVIEYLAN